MFVVAPGNVLHDDSMFGALHPPRDVAKRGGNSPQRDRKPAALRQAVITMSGSLAVEQRGHMPACGTRVISIDSAFPRVAEQAHLGIHESDKTLRPVQDRHNL